MKKGILAMTIIAVGIIGCCNTINAMEYLGTIDYKDYIQTDIIADDEVNLTYLFSSLDESYLTVDKILYIPSINKTKYIFTSNVIEPEWWMNFSEVSFFYQDENSLEIYEIKVDYTDVEIPFNPWEVELENLTGYFDNLTVDYSNLSNNIADLNTTYNTIKGEYKETLEELLEKRSELSDMSVEYAEITVQIDNVTSQLENMTVQYNNTYNLLIEQGTNASLFKMFYEYMNSGYRTGFSFTDPETRIEQHFIPRAETNNIITDMQNEINMGPYLMFLAIIITGIICFIVKMMFKKEIKTPLQIEQESGYKPESNTFDNFVSRFRLRKKEPVNEEVVPFEPVSNSAEIKLMKTDIAGINNKVDKLLDALAKTTKGKTA